MVAERLRQRIWKGKLKFGERLYETSLADEFGVSRSTLREGFQALEFEDLLANHQRKGTFVTNFSDKDLQEIKEARAMLEAQVFVSASEEMDNQDIQNLENIINKMKELSKEEKWSEMFDADLEFHLYVVNNCNNSRIQKLYNVIEVQIRTFLSTLEEYYKNDTDLFYREHLDLIEALKSKDKIFIRKVITRHIYR